jgi:hypothetical protein
VKKPSAGQLNYLNRQLIISLNKEPGSFSHLPNLLGHVEEIVFGFVIINSVKCAGQDCSKGNIILGCPECATFFTAFHCEVILVILCS